MNDDYQTQFNENYLSQQTIIFNQQTQEYSWVEYSIKWEY